MIERTRPDPDRCPRGCATPEGASFDLIALSVTHELRQPLSLICGYAELLATRPLPEDERVALLGQIRRAAERLSASLARLERAERLELVAFAAGERHVLDLRPATSGPCTADVPLRPSGPGGPEGERPHSGDGGGSVGGSGWSGQVKRTVVVPSGAESAEIAPPHPSTKRRQIASPRPVPGRSPTLRPR